MSQEDHEEDDTPSGSLSIFSIPERNVGDFNSTGSTGIQVDLELQFGTDLKSEKLLKDFLTRFEKLKKTEDKAS